MWRKAIATTARGVGALHHPWRTTAHGHSTAVSPSDAVNSILLRSLKEHYLDVTKMNPPPKINPPSPFTVVQGSLDGNGPALKRTFGDEEITISVMRLANIVPGDGGEDDGADDGDDINQLFLHVDVSKPGRRSLCIFFVGCIRTLWGFTLYPCAPNLMLRALLRTLPPILVLFLKILMKR
ncbi:mitochondrial acidic protein MAM33 [Prunus yedoensis var. nudiflora]|uniref:Mitochondrial acidic protein MAM33 n=1 Tax=Prunus yedoensis var. nudiflora TaxID=2094558 RepID=A0A314UY80_PRUYE|nr:mitochondrial acidic protein MAM33 [Prunus yedoensis var. nudiflora]